MLFAVVASQQRGADATAGAADGPAGAAAAAKLTRGDGAAGLGLGLTGDAIGIEFDGEGRMVALKPAFGGNIVAPILSKTFPQMATVRAGVLELGYSGTQGRKLLLGNSPNLNQLDPKYLALGAALNDQVANPFFGIITSESPASISMKGLDGKERTILRTSIKTLAGTNRSLMPDGLESAVSKQDLADVIRFLQSAPGGN